ncbi:hypothetical protein GGI21_004801 [Coemansia aciculifera]|uniref:Uncharacterized protein n=1 Tax=Coemansia aciculifera TaxID=417176 RepID=A0ACC1M4C4_9FUNG|nr:hypothetical protein IWW38_002145 [Coemansia aciculifera]KAJ2899502.1 hypothetical protein GGI21_004801 [Coemansia aciculifera]
MDQQQKEKAVVKTTERTLEEWGKLFNEGYLVGYPKDAKPEPAKPQAKKDDGEQNMENAEPEDRGPLVDTPTSSEEKTKEKEVKKKLVNWTDLPQPVRVLWPNSRVTRDLRPNRLNLYCGADDKITKVAFF